MVDRENTIPRITHNITEQIKQLTPKRHKYVGEVRLPSKAYQSASVPIAIILERTPLVSLEKDTLFTVEDSGNGKTVTIQVPKLEDVEQFLEIEMLAAGVDVAGEIRQRKNISSSKLIYRWNCLFQKTGKQTMEFVIRLVNIQNSTNDVTLEEIELGLIRQTTRVVKLDGLTQTQIWIAASAAAAVSTIAAIASIIMTLVELGVF